MTGNFVTGWHSSTKRSLHHAHHGSTRNARPPQRRSATDDSWIFNDTKDQLEWRNRPSGKTGMAWAEEPPSRTVHENQQSPRKAKPTSQRICGEVNYLLYRQKSAMNI
ncbi:aromatic-ring-hydroxylating dioxygenase subunit beta [Shigella flexneri]